MRGQQNLGAVADAQLVRDVHSGRGQLLDFLQQRHRIDHQAVADHRDLARMQNAARHQPQHEFAVADQDRVAGVVAALIAHDVVEAVGEQIDQLALAFVAPLRAENDDIAHYFIESWRVIRPNGLL